MAGIEFQGVTKRFPDGTVAVDDISLDVPDGEFMILVGPSGCGKTTALRMVAGLKEITAGKVVIGGRVVNELEPKERDVAMVFQNYALPAHDRAGQHRLPAQDAEGGEVRDRRPGGRGDAPARPRRAAPPQAARALGRPAPAGRHGPGDRPAPAGVPDGRAAVESGREAARPDAGRARQPARRLGVTTLYVTHDQTEAMTLGTRVAVLRGGVIQQVDPPQRLYHRPANTFVASFIGSPPMNFAAGTLSEGSLELGPFRFDVPEAVRRRLRSREGAVLAGLRPEHFKDAAPGRGPRSDGARGRRDHPGRFGPETYAYFRIPGLEATEVGERPIELAGGLRGPPGSALGCGARRAPDAGARPRRGAALRRRERRFHPR